MLWDRDIDTTGKVDDGWPPPERSYRVAESVTTRYCAGEDGQ